MPDDEETEYVCPECGSEVAEDAKFCPECGTSQSEEDDEEQESEEPEADEDEEKEQAKAPEPKAVEAKETAVAGKPAKEKTYAVVKLLKKTAYRDDGSTTTTNQITTLKDGIYTNHIPTKADIEAFFVPYYGGGKYIIRDTSTKGSVKTYEFPGPQKDPDDLSAPLGQAQEPVAPTPQAPATPPQVVPSPSTTAASLVEKFQSAQSSAQNSSVAQLSKLADILCAKGDIDGLAKVIESLQAIAIGKKIDSSSDKMIDYMMVQQGNLMNAILAGSKKGEPGAAEIMKDSMSMMRDMIGISKDLTPTADSTVALAEAIGSTVKDSVKEITDTVVKVTGSGSLQGAESRQPPPQKEIFQCSNCKKEVPQGSKVCPFCGVVFTGMTRQLQPGQQAPQPPQTEIFPGSVPRIPPEIKSRLSTLHNLAVMIKENHNPEVKGGAFFHAADNRGKTALLFAAEFGYDNIMKLALPFKGSPEIPEGPELFKTIESPQGKNWITRLFRAIRLAAGEEQFSITDEQRNQLLAAINQYSPVKFRPIVTKRPLGVPNPPGTGMVECPICHIPIEVTGLEGHMEINHPLPKKPKQEPEQLPPSFIPQSEPVPATRKPETKGEEEGTG